MCCISREDNTSAASANAAICDGPLMPKIPKGVGSGSRASVLRFLLKNMGRVVSSDEIRHATGTSEWARRLRELRDEFGYAILTCADETRAKSRGISKASLFKHPIIKRLLLQIQRVRLLERVPVRQTRVSATSIVPTFVPTQQTDGHRCAQPATC